jgi:hypothetical protein
MNGKVEAIVAGSAALGATAVAALPDSETLEAVGRWPLVVVLGAVCCFCVWIIYLQGCQFGKRLDKLSDAIRHLAENIKERPSGRDRGRDAG